MLKKVVKTIIIILILTILVSLNEQMLPQRKELTDIAVVRIKGLDKVGDEAVISAVSIDTQGGGQSSSNSGDGESGGNNSVIISKGSSFKIAEKNAQAYTDKAIDAGHLRYTFVGEETAKTDFNAPISYVATNEEIRLSTKVYVIKGYTAEEFLKKVINNKYDISEKLRNITENNKQLGLTTDIDLKDIMSRIEADINKGIVPVLELQAEEVISQGENSSSDGSSNSSDSNSSSSSNNKQNQNINFNLGGYAVFKDLKLVGYLTQEQSIGYNFIKNYIQSIALTVKSLSNKSLEIGLTEANTDIEFEFDGDSVKKIKIKVMAKANLEETDLVNKYFTPEERENLEKQIKNQIKGNIISAINVAKELDVDYLNLTEDVLSKKHPYKYKKIKDNIKNIWKEVDTEVEVEAEIERDYDVFNLTENER